MDEWALKRLVFAEFANSLNHYTAYKQQAYPVLPTLPNLPIGLNYSYLHVGVNTDIVSITLFATMTYRIKHN